MPNQLVCVSCWKWYDARTVCPSCKVPLIDPGTGQPVVAQAAPAGYEAAGGPPPWAGSGPHLGTTDYGEELPQVSGYPTGTPVTAPTRTQVHHYLVDGAQGTPATAGTLQARMTPPPLWGAAAASIPVDPAPSPPPMADGGEAGGALGTPTWGIRGPVGPAARPLLPPPDRGSPAASVHSPAPPAPAPPAPDASQPRWQPGVPLGHPLGPPPPPRDSGAGARAPGAVPPLRPLPPPLLPSPPLASALPPPPPLALHAPLTGPPARPPAPPPAPPDPRGQVSFSAPAVAVPSAVGPPPSPWARPIPNGAPAVSPAADPAPPSWASPAPPLSPVPVPEASINVAPATAAPLPTPRRGALVVAAATGLLVALVVAALWVAAAVATGLDLAPLAVVVGAAAGLVVGRSAPSGRSGAAISAGLVALVAIALGLLFSAVAAYSSGQGASFLTAVGLLDRSFLPHLWEETGALGAVLGVAGVVLAGLVTLPRRRGSAA